MFIYNLLNAGNTQSMTTNVDFIFNTPELHVLLNSNQWTLIEQETCTGTVDGTYNDAVVQKHSFNCLLL